MTHIGRPRLLQIYLSAHGGERGQTGGPSCLVLGTMQGALLDTPEASQEATQAVGDDSDPLPAPLAAAGAAPEAEQEAVWGEINPEKLAQARRIQPGASVPDLEGWGALRPGKKELLFVMRERLTTEEVNRGRPAPGQWPAKRMYNWLKERAPPCVVEASLLDSEEQAAPGLPPPGQPQPTSGLSTESVTDSLGDDSSALHGSSQLGSHGGAPNEAAAVNEGDGEALGHGVRWVKRIHTVRLIECICGDDLRDAYLH